MTAYDVEAALRHVAAARVNPDALTRTTMVLADDFTAGLRRDFGDKLDMETVGLALSIAASAVAPLTRHRVVPTAVLVNLLAFAGEDLVRTTRAANSNVDDQPSQRETPVLTWHPLNGKPPVQIPLRQHWVFPAESCGEFTVTLHAEEQDGASCPS